MLTKTCAMRGATFRDNIARVVHPHLDVIIHIAVREPYVKGWKDSLASMFNSKFTMTNSEVVSAMSDSVVEDGDLTVDDQEEVVPTIIEAPAAPLRHMAP